MSLMGGAWGIISAISVFLIGFLIVVFLAKKLRSEKNRPIFIYAWHTMFCVIYALYVADNGGDALMYYGRELVDGGEFRLGTVAVNYFAQTIKHGLNLSFLGVSLVFNIFGSIGLVAFDVCMRKYTNHGSKKLQRLASVIVFLPSISFWSSGIGKDALAFMAVGLALWASQNIGRHVLLMMFAVATMLVVRPHMAAIMTLSLVTGFVFYGRIGLIPRVILGAIAFSAATIIVPIALNQSGLGADVDEGALIEYVEKRQGYNMEGGGGVDIANMPLPLQLFTYLFRPLPFEARNVFTLAASADNMIILYLFFMGGRVVFSKRKLIFAENRPFLWLYSLSAWLLLAMTTANMGISMRQKWMFAPVLIFLFMSVIASAQRINARGVRVAPHLSITSLLRPPLRKP